MAKSETVGEQVRLPGIINMDLEATKIRTLDEACGVVTEEKMLHLNIPLQISVDTKALNPSGVYSPSVTKQSRGSSTEDRGRIPSSTLQPRSRTPSGRIRSASVGRGDKKQEMAARYWAVLFENLRRAVDDLYRTCEGDESAVAAKEVLMVLENYVKDFKNLINWLKLNTEFEKTPAPSRPTSLTWDIRKTSPAGRNTPTGSGKLTPTRQLLLCSPAKRQLNFDEKEENRSRTVSETIKESNREHEMSPSSEPAMEQQIEPDINIEDIEIDANVSEHEKSDSEQEKNKGNYPFLIILLHPMCY